MDFIKLFEGSDMFYLADPAILTIKKNGGSRWGVEREFNIPLAVAMAGHLDGTSKKGVVLPPIRKSDNKCLFSAIDVDGNIYKDDNFKRQILDKIKEFKLPLVACFSKSKGLHLYIKFHNWTDAKIVIDILHTFLHKLGLPQNTECFPKQAEVGKMGNGIMLPYMYGVENDWIKTYNSTGFSTGTKDEFKEYLQAKRVNAEDIQIDLPEAVKANGKTEGKTDDADWGDSKFTILKKIKDGTIETHPTMGGKYHSWIQVVIAKCVKEGYGDNEILELIKEVHQDKRGLEYTWPKSYQKQIDYVRGPTRWNKPNPGDTNILEGRSALEGFYDEEDEAKQKQFYKDIIYIKLDDRWYDKSTGAEYKEKAIKVAYGSYFDGDVIKTFGKNADAQLVEQTVYRPDLYNEEDPIVFDEDELPQLNNYRPGGVEPMEPDTPQLQQELQQFKDLIRKLTGHEKIGHKDTGEEIDLYEYVLDHLGMPLKRAGEKIRSALLFHSKSKQVGKTTLAKIMQKILGAKNTTIISPTNAIDRQKSFIENQLVFIDEIKIDGNIDEKKAVMNKLKPLMTDELHDCRPLFKDWRRVYATGSFILNTNFKDAMALDADEARYTCIDVGKTRQELGGDDFYDELYKSVKHGTLANVVKHFLLHREISENFNPAGLCLKTKFLQEMHKAGGHPVLPEVELLFKAREEPFHQSILTHGDAWEYCKIEKKIRGKSSDFTHALEQLGCERVGEVRHRRSSKNLTVYIVRNHEFFTDKTKSQILNDYWIPLDAVSNIGSPKYNLSGGDMSVLESKQKEIQAFEDFRFPVGNDDPEADLLFEEIRKKRMAGY